MLKRRIIPCLDIRDGRTVKGVNFINLVDAGDPVELAKAYLNQGADELVFLDITATIENRKTLIGLVERIAAEINIPFTVGGGTDTIKDVANLLSAGADKVTVNSAAVKRPDLIPELAGQFGNQCIVVAIDARQVPNGEAPKWEVLTHGGRKGTGKDAVAWARQAVALGAEQGKALPYRMPYSGRENYHYVTDVGAHFALCAGRTCICRRNAQFIRVTKSGFSRATLRA